MYSILFDDNFYLNTVEQLEYFNKLIEIIKKYFDAQIILFVPFYKQSSTYHLSSMSQIINKKILETRKGKRYDVNEVSEVGNKQLESFGFSKAFIGKIHYLKEVETNSSIIVPLCFNQTDDALPVKGYLDFVYYIGNFDRELNSNIAMWIQNNELISIPVPCKNEMFGGKELCDGYDKRRSGILKSFQLDTKKSLFEQIGTEVALRNHYVYDSKLSALNKRKAKPVRDKTTGEITKPKRKVFKSSAGEMFYLSLDFENGGFEVFDKNAKFLGQYRFNGKFEKKSDPNTHKLYLK